MSKRFSLKQFLEKHVFFYTDSLEKMLKNKLPITKGIAEVHDLAKECKSKTFKKWILEYTELIPNRFLEKTFSKMDLEPSKIYEYPQRVRQLFRDNAVHFQLARKTYFNILSSYDPNYEFSIREQTNSELLK